MDNMNLNWKDKQANEFKHWKEKELPFKFKFYNEWYDKTYVDIDKFIKYMGTRYTVADIGCGGYSFVARYEFDKIYLIDSLIDQYALLPGNNLQNRNMICEKAEDLDFKENSIDITFALNFLDHADPNSVDLILKNISRFTSKYIIIFVDYRKKEDSCHYIFNNDFSVLKDKFDLFKVINIKRGCRCNPIFCREYFFKNNNTGDYVEENKEYWWGE